MISITRDIGLVSFTGNPIMISVESYNYLDGGELRPFYTMFCDVYLDDPGGGADPIYTDSIQPDADGKGQFDLAEILKKHTNPTLPWPVTSDMQAVKDAGARISFWFKLYDGWGLEFITQSPYYQSPVRYAIPGGFSDSVLQNIEDGTSNCFSFLQANKIFLTSQPLAKKIFSTQVELLRFFNYKETTETFTLKLKKYFWNGSDTTSTLWSSSLDPLSLYSFNVTPDHIGIDADVDFWEIWLEANGTEASEVVSYSKNEKHPTLPRLFMLRNSLAGFDSLVATGQRNLIAEGDATSGYVAKRSAVRRWLDPIQDRRNSKTVYKGSLGFFSNEELMWLKEFFLSEQKYLEVDGKLEFVRLRNSEFPEHVDEPPGEIEIEAVLGSPFTFFFS